MMFMIKKLKEKILIMLLLEEIDLQLPLAFYLNNLLELPIEELRHFKNQ